MDSSWGYNWKVLPVEMKVDWNGRHQFQKSATQDLCNWWKSEFLKWKQLAAQGHGIENFENDKISNGWLMQYRGIPHRKLITALQLRANVFPTREFPARGRLGNCFRSCRHCGAAFESSAHIIGN